MLRLRTVTAMSWYTWFPILVALVVFALSLGAGEIGFRLGKQVLPKDEKSLGMTQANIIAGALLGLVGLLLAFSFSFGENRYDIRRHLVVAEGSDISTALLRAQLFPGPQSDQLIRELHAYTELRLARIDRGESDAGRTRADAQSEQLSEKIWASFARLRTVTRKDDMSKEVGLALNSVFDASEYERDAEADTLPTLILLMLIASTLVASAATGYAACIDRHRRRIYEVEFALVVAVVVYTILDLNLPYGGFIHAYDEPLRHVLLAFPTSS